MSVANGPVVRYQGPDGDAALPPSPDRAPLREPPPQTQGRARPPGPENGGVRAPRLEDVLALGGSCPGWNTSPSMNGGLELRCHPMPSPLAPCVLASGPHPGHAVPVCSLWLTANREWQPLRAGSCLKPTRDLKALLFAPGGRMLAFSGSLWVASAGFPVTGPAAGRRASSVGSLLPFLLPAPPCLGAGSLELEAARVAPAWPPPPPALSPQALVATLRGRLLLTRAELSRDPCESHCRRSSPWHGN